MFRAVITDRGDTWLGEAGVTPAHDALAALVSPQLEAANPRALFDAFCARLTERRGTPQSIDECRSLWRALCDHGVIAVRGSVQIDAGCAFALKEPMVEGIWPQWVGKQDDNVPEAPNREDVALIPRRVSTLVRNTLARLVGDAPDK
jgi:hypothetical protein